MFHSLSAPKIIAKSHLLSFLFETLGKTQYGYLQYLKTLCRSVYIAFIIVEMCAEPGTSITPKGARPLKTD